MSSPFSSQVSPVSALDLPHTHKTGCPVDVEELVEVRFTHVDFRGLDALGALVVNAAIAQPLLTVLQAAHHLRFPIQKAVPIDHEPYCGDDDISMADNNSSCFNYRHIAGTNRVSTHSFGLAVDINPSLNPYLQSDGIWKPNTKHVDRSIGVPGMFFADHPIVTEFAEHGFEWGGLWERPDYHHFEFVIA